MLKVLLVNPPKSDFSTTRSQDMPLSLIYLGSYIEGYADIEIFDFNIVERNAAVVLFREKIEKYAPDVVGITCLHSGIFSLAYAVAKEVRALCPNVNIILGGMHPTIFAHEIMDHCPEIDCVCLGEGEVHFKAYLKYLNQEISSDHLSGVIYRNTKKDIIEKKIADYVDVSRLPLPNYNLLDLNSYKIDTSRWYDPLEKGINSLVCPVLTSRSCPNMCSFCSMNLVMGKQYRPCDPDYVCKIIDDLYYEKKVNYLRIMDDNFTLNKLRTMRICRHIIDSGMSVYFETPNGVMTNTLDDEVIDALAEAGLLVVTLAIESGSDFIRNKIMKKNLSLNKIYEVVRSIRRYPHIHLKAFFLIGMPEETRESIEDTYRLVSELDLDEFILSRIIPFPGTKLFDQCLSDDILVEKDLSNLCFSEKFLSTSSETDKFRITPYHLSIAELEAHDLRLRELIKMKNRRLDG